MYTIRRHRRAKYMHLRVHADGRVVVSMPYGVTLALVERFIEERRQWISKHVEVFQKIQIMKPKKDARHEYIFYKEHARKYIAERAGHFAQVYGFAFKKIAIRNQQTRWGSCSRDGNLNFNYRLVFLPEEMAEYIIAHELCHLKEMNHSKRFWLLVGELVPEYKDIKKRLKKYSHLYH